MQTGYYYTKGYTKGKGYYEGTKGKGYYYSKGYAEGTHEKVSLFSV
jgi:hypothetical protein